jgi:hypothetical protein
MSYRGCRQPEIDGTATAAELDSMLLSRAEATGYQLEIFYAHVVHFHCCVINGCWSPAKTGSPLCRGGRADTGRSWQCSSKRAGAYCAGSPALGSHLEQADALDMARWDHSGGFSLDASVRIEATTRPGWNGCCGCCARRPSLWRGWSSCVATRSSIAYQASARGTQPTTSAAGGLPGRRELCGDQGPRTYPLDRAREATEPGVRTQTLWRQSLCSRGAGMGAGFLCADLGITPEPRVNHPPIWRTWLKCFMRTSSQSSALPLTPSAPSITCTASM